jgi:hypothetical protein
MGRAEVVGGYPLTKHCLLWDDAADWRSRVDLRCIIWWYYLACIRETAEACRKAAGV